MFGKRGADLFDHHGAAETNTESHHATIAPFPSPADDRSHVGEAALPIELPEPSEGSFVVVIRHDATAHAPKWIGDHHLSRIR